MEQLATAPPAPAPSTTAARSVPSHGGAPVIAAYAITIFTSAFLLFQVQPLISKFILPWFGGSPAVWTAAMLFFQVVLFGGYLYAHLTSTYLKPRAQFALHLALLAFAAVLTLYTQISPSSSLKPTGNENESPLFQILLVLGASVGVPYFALSSTGPLLQKWFSDAFAGASPYRLFALSNVGSLLALLSYPFFFEVHWDSREQAAMWSAGFVAFALCCSFCAWWTFRARQTHADHAARSPARHADSSADQAPSWLLRAAWIGLPALASVMFLAVTNEVCQNVATVPLLWIIPLSFYLISFIVAFDHPRWYSRPICAVGAMLLLVYVSNFGRIAGWLSDTLTSLAGRTAENPIEVDTWVMEIAAYFSALLLVCLICHCELAALKPGPKHLTFYFLSMSFGGALGGIFVNLVAPEIFNTFFEMPLAFLASAAIAGWLLATWASKYGRPALTAAATVCVLALATIAYGQIIKPMRVSSNASTLTIFRDRSFFGLVSVQHRSRNEPEFTNFAFRSGRVPHGKEFADPERRNDTRLAYWGPDTGCRVALEYKIAKEPSCHIGVVGLGIGTIAAFAKETDRLRFYEINPQVTNIAKKYFHFLSDCKAPYDIVHGDARLKLEEELAKTGGHQFDVLCLDAFSGDAVPTHLLTTEAFVTYKQHLKPDGIIVCNITNSYLDLWPVIKGLADEHGLKSARIYRPTVPDSLIERTYFAILTNDEGFLGPTMTAVRDRLKDQLDDAGAPPGPIPQVLISMPANFQKVRTIPLWTDRYHNLFQVLR